jgi:hypothetical protein
MQQTETELQCSHLLSKVHRPVCSDHLHNNQLSKHEGCEKPASKYTPSPVREHTTTENCHVKFRSTGTQHLVNSMTIPVGARSKMWVCGCSLAGIAGANPTGGIDIPLF